MGEAVPQPARPRREREPLRNVRVPDELWDDAKWAVALRGDASVSHIVRVALDRYVADTRRRQARGELPDGLSGLE